MLSFSIFCEASKSIPNPTDMKRIVIAPGRYNPPHQGHKLLIERLVDLGKKLNADPVVIVVDSGKYDKRNPLDGKTRALYLEKMFPGMTIAIAPNPYEAVVSLKDKGMVPVGSVSGSDRAESYKAMVGRVFQTSDMEYMTEVIVRDPDSDTVAGISASKVRQAAYDNDFAKFRAMIGLERDDTKALFESVRNGVHQE